MIESTFPINESNLQINFGVESIIFLHCKLDIMNQGESIGICKWIILPKFKTEVCEVCGEGFKNHERCNLTIVCGLNPFSILTHEGCYKMATLKQGF